MKDVRSIRGWQFVLVLLTTSSSCGQQSAPAAQAPSPARGGAVPVASPAPPPPNDPPSIRLELEPQVSTFLEDRLRARLPAGSAPSLRLHVRRPGGQPGPTTNAGSMMIDFGPVDLQLGLAAYDALRLAGPDFEGQVRQHLGRRPPPSFGPSDAPPPRFEVRALANAGPIRVVLVLPDRLVLSGFCPLRVELAGGCETDETFMAAELLLAEADGMVHVIDFLCKEGSCPRAALQTLAVDLAATLEPGPSPLVRGAGPRYMGAAFEVDAPADFVVRTDSGADHMGWILEPVVPLGATSGNSLTIRRLGDEVPPRETAPTTPGRLFGQAIQWSAPPSSDPTILTRIHDCTLAGQAFSFRLSAGSEQGLAEVTRIAESARIVMGAWRNQPCVPPGTAPRK